MEHKLPWELTCFVSAIGSSTKSDESIKLYTYWNIPFEWPAFIAEKHLFKGVNQIRGDVFIEGGLDLLKDESEVIEAWDHHVQTSDSLVRADLLIV